MATERLAKLPYGDGTFLYIRLDLVEIMYLTPADECVVIAHGIKTQFTKAVGKLLQAAFNDYYNELELAREQGRLF